MIKFDDLLPPFTGIFRLDYGNLTQLKLAVYDANLQFKIKTQGIEHIEITSLPAEVRTYTGGFSAKGNAFLVKENNPVWIFTGISQKDMPYIVLIQPDGKRMDPKKELPQKRTNFRYREDIEDKTVSFLIGKPMAGFWTADIRNAGEAGKEYAYSFQAEDWDNYPLIFMRENALEGLVIHNEERTLYWIPSDKDAGDTFVVFVVSDSRVGRDIQEFTLKVATEDTSITNVEAIFIDSESGPVFEVQVIDYLADIDSNVQDELTVKIADVFGYEEWELILYETSANSGIFNRSIDLLSSFGPIPHWLLIEPLQNVDHELAVN